jgi:hypothetical protein
MESYTIKQLKDVIVKYNLKTKIVGYSKQNKDDLIANIKKHLDHNNGTFTPKIIQPIIIKSNFGATGTAGTTNINTISGPNLIGLTYPEVLSDDIKSKVAEIFEYDNKSKYNNTNTTGYVLCELSTFDTETNTTETEHTEGGERVQCAQQ